MLQKNIILISTNNILCSWCRKELSMSFKVTQILDSINLLKLLDSKNEYVCILMDYDICGEIKLLAQIQFACDNLKLPVLVLCHSSNKIDKNKFSKEMDFFSLFSESSKLNQKINILLTNRNHIQDKHSLRIKYNRQKKVIDTKQQLNQQVFNFDADKFDIFSGNSPIMVLFREQIIKAAMTDEPVLLLGDSGCGKTYTAQYIHNNSSRREKVFYHINVAELTETLSESQLFGVSKGAYTGAIGNKGLFETSNGGTLFLDEIGELSINLQSKLLDVLESQKFRRLGSFKEYSFNTRLLFATNKNLRKSMANREFRSDLFYRINVISIKVPSLHEHLEDVPGLAKNFVKLYRKTLSSQSIEKLCEYNWPGNIRELHNVLRSACTFSGVDVIKPEDIHFYDL